MSKYIQKEIMDVFSVDKFYMSSSEAIDPTIESINSSEPDILESGVSYREERKVN